jgi:hypothetical protein
MCAVDPMLANMTPEQVEEYVKNGAQRRLKQSCNYAGLPRTGTGGREYETGATYRVMDDAEPLVHRSASGRVYQPGRIIRPNRADRHFVERQGDAASGYLLQLR